MSLQEMTQTRKRALWAAVVWSLSAVGFCLAFFTGGGADEFDTDSLRHLLAAAAIAFGFLADGIGRWLTRKREGRVVVDERDRMVVARAGQSTLVVLILGIFLLTVTLWTLHESEGVVAVGWMWFLAYGAVYLTFITYATATLVLDRRTGGHG